ncbi:MAG: (2Fe-2S)-binding protein [Candidatus Cloacimonetes bacterium]|nr:(2Fe-2S)-binding protein [Candidatus Cloacimonadota bacterium]
MTISFLLNNEPVTITTEPMRRLLDVLREDLKVRSVKESCGEGECGACSVILAGKPVTSCLVNIAQVEGIEVLTAEGISQTPAGKILIDCFEETNAVQCGFCFTGFLVSCWHYLTTTPVADAEAIKQAISGNICRCTGYVKIIEAVQLACQRINKEQSHEIS